MATGREIVDGMRITRPLTVSAMAALLAVGLSGCVKLDLDLRLQPEDTIDGTLVLAVSNELAELLGQDADGLAAELQSELLGSDDAPADLDAEPYDDGEYVGSTATFTGEPLDAFDGENLQITREGEEFVVTGLLDLTETDAEQVPGLDPEPDIRVAVTFPGPVSEHDGELDGTTVTWAPSAGERLELNARGSAVPTAVGATFGAGGMLWLVGLSLLGLLVVAGAVLAVVLTRRRTRDATPLRVTPADQPPPPAGDDGRTGR